MEAGLKLALGVQKAIPPKRGRQHARNTDLCHGPWNRNIFTEV